MNFVVAICTFNRAEMLRMALESILVAEPPMVSTFSIVVVNNRCTDHTDRVIAEFASRGPVFRVYEDTPGLSRARNAAVKSMAAASADYIVWTDDDVKVGKGWLRGYEEAFLRHPDSAFFGGDVLPWFETVPPDWLSENIDILGGVYAIREFGERFQLCVQESRLPFGANFAVRGTEQRSLLFDPCLGVVGQRRIGGEETGLMVKLLDNGHTGWWVPEATVEHLIPRRRMTLAYVGEYYRGKGRTEAITRRDDGLPFHLRPLWMWRRAIEEFVGFLVHRIRGESREWVGHYRLANYYVGRLLA